MATWHEVQRCEAGPTFRERLDADDRVALDAAELDQIFDPRSFLTRADVVFERLESCTFE